MRLFLEISYQLSHACRFRVMMCYWQNVSGQTITAEETGTAAEGWDTSDVHEEDEEIGAAVQRAAAAVFSVGQTRAGGCAGRVQEREGAGQ